MHLNDIPSKEFIPGLHGKIVHGERLSWAFWEVEKGAIVPEHQHHNEQMMHVVEGKFEFTLNGETQVYTNGAVVHIPSNSPHAGKALTHCHLMDIFSPIRNEYK
ncbi:cupin domain-containing protein [Flavobacteriaceae bacterium]|nr:cupin domain-containing protein [Flavobacteriaceae bacterium]MDB9941677.1 cupin domain-containing protein [Flavobacteriaceae bacterium]